MQKINVRVPAGKGGGGNDFNDAKNESGNMQVLTATDDFLFPPPPWALHSLRLGVSGVSPSETPWSAPLVFEWLLAKGEGVLRRRRRLGQRLRPTEAAVHRGRHPGLLGCVLEKNHAANPDRRTLLACAIWTLSLAFFAPTPGARTAMPPSVDGDSFLPAAEACFLVERRKRGARRCPHTPRLLEQLIKVSFREHLSRSHLKYLNYRKRLTFLVR
ncbi:hypothetical protein HPB51_011792 [Rhipicephalus microplus]|uniref:Uncharacterized protein n=1 Tax=Rhipicephalus microplus TaxID=6941 RepID=A0A9J6DFW7_RHIMP|nr:hypothetical protein HPB51_011792 [Rhipicephalus microplus]